jgi:hypothetical protein
MTEEELSKMISEFLPYPAEGQHHALKQFAKLVAAAERLAVKKDIEEEMTDELDDQAYHLCMELIAKILKRDAP